MKIIYFAIAIIIVSCVLAACQAESYNSSSVLNQTPALETTTPGLEGKRPIRELPEDPLPSLITPQEYLPSIFPEQYLESIEQYAWDTHVKALLTNGEFLVVPDMKLEDLPQSFQESLKCTARDLSYSEYLNADSSEFQNILCSIYKTMDLQIVTVYFDMQKSDICSDAGVEYIRDVAACSDVFCTYQGIRLGDSSERCGLDQNSKFNSPGTPYMSYVTSDGILSELSAGSSREIQTLKSQEIYLFHPDE